MKLFIIFYFTTSIFLFRKVGTVNKKMQKSFDEIFGKGWDGEEAILRDESNDQQERNDQPDNFDQADDQNGAFIQRNTAGSADQIPVEDENNGEKINSQQKKEIIIKFRAIKKQIKQKVGKLSSKEWNKIDRLIANKLGTNRKEIFKTIRKFGMEKQKTNSNKFSDQQKREIVGKFYVIKEEIKQKGRKYSAKEWQKIERIIGKGLGTNRDYIYEWIKTSGMGVKMRHSDFEKVEIIKQFDEMTRKVKQNQTFSAKEWRQNYNKMSKKLGICYSTIQKWKREFGMCQKRKIYTEQEKLRIMRQYWEMKRTNPSISDNEIAKKLQIDKTNIFRWKGKI